MCARVCSHVHAAEHLGWSEDDCESWFSPSAVWSQRVDSGCRGGQALLPAEPPKTTSQTQSPPLLAVHQEASPLSQASLTHFVCDSSRELSSKEAETSPSPRPASCERDRRRLSLEPWHPRSFQKKREETKEITPTEAKAHTNSSVQIPEPMAGTWWLTETPAHVHLPSPRDGSNGGLQPHPYPRGKQGKPTVTLSSGLLCLLRLTPGSPWACNPDLSKRPLPNSAHMCGTQDPTSLETTP